MTDIAKVNERRWSLADGMAQVAELITGDPQNPRVFQLGIKQNPVTHKQLAALKDLFAMVLEDAPEARIVVPLGAGKLAVPQR